MIDDDKILQNTDEIQNISIKNMFSLLNQKMHLLDKNDISDIMEILNRK